MRIMEEIMDYNKRVIVAGAGKSGMDAARLLLKHGAEVIIFDENDKVDKVDILVQLKEFDKVGVVIGKLDESLLDTVDYMVISPGISIEAAFTEPFKERNIPIWSEIELAFHASKGKLAAITGTNGKTTTTSLVGEIFSAYNSSSFMVGNIGIPYTSIADQTTEDSMTVAEISSFQLETIVDFQPDVSAVLNVTPDHLNRHHTFECYRDTKQRIAENQTADQVCILNYDDENTRSMGDNIPAAPVYFSTTKDLKEGICLKDQTLVIRTSRIQDSKEEGGFRTIEVPEEYPVLTIEEMRLLGSHNVENYLAAIGIAYYMGVPVDVIRKVYMEFKGVEHRIEYVKEVKNVAYYNDSKGNNPDAAIKGIQAMNRPTLLIGGGYDKKVPFDDWILSFEGKVRYLVLIGQTAQLIAETAEKYGFHDIIFEDNLVAAVNTCYRLANPGDAVLLSPACASWGQFDNYEQRGDLFKEYVRNLPEE